MKPKENNVRFTIDMNEDLHQEFKLCCSLQKTKMKTIMIDKIKEFIEITKNKSNKQEIN